MPERTTESLIQELLKNGRPNEVDFANTLIEYAQTKDHTLVSKLPDDPGWSAYSIGPQSIHDLAEAPLHIAIAELVALKIKLGIKADNRFINKFCKIAVRSEKGSLRLIHASEAVDLTPTALATFLTLTCDDEFKFGWTDLKSEQQGQTRRRTSPENFNQVIPTDTSAFTLIEKFIWDLSDDTLVEILHQHHKIRGNRYRSKLALADTLQGSLSALKPSAIERFIDQTLNANKNRPVIAWDYILRASESFDDRCIAHTEACSPDIRARVLITLNYLRDGKHSEIARQAALSPSNRLDDWSLTFISEHFPIDLIDVISSAIAAGERLQHNMSRSTQFEVLQSLTANWNDGGKTVFDKLAHLPVDGDRADFHVFAIQALLDGPTDASQTDQHDWLKALTDYFIKEKSIPMEHTASLWQKIVELKPQVMENELWELLAGKSKILRDIAVQGLAKVDNASKYSKAIEQLSAKRMDPRLGATALLQALGGSEAIKGLQDALETEKSDKVRTAMHTALESLGVVSAEPDDESPELSYAELLTEIDKQANKIKLPKGNWLQLDQLPPLKTTDGSTLSELALTFLIQKQSMQKTITPAGDVLPLIQQLDRAQSTPFALALFNQWMASDQVAADRWVLTLTGLLSNTSAIPVLIKPIPGWAENSRHKMAEYAAQATALIPGDEALTVLDSLATRYRSKFKNIGTACRAALVLAAEDRGVSLDDLADMIVPNFDFDEDGQRSFEWDGGSVIAELGIDFKLTWVDPETEKTRKALPTSAPAELKNEVNVLKKLIRESVKGQTARLELNLVRQRRWPISRWQELFEKHPLLRAFASRLVWGLYDTEGKLVQSFRRYPNGLLANAQGALIELEESPLSVGMVHPLELEQEALSAWQEHLGRFKIKPPFPQLDRPTVTLKDLHGNRKEITFTDRKEISYGTFRSRCEKRGWARGSVIDAGGISSYYKQFPGAGIEIYLLLEECWVGMDPMDTVSLSIALFAKENSIRRGSYTYDEPGNGDDPRVVNFSQVPPVVYSESISDLYVIIGESPTEA